MNRSEAYLDIVGIPERLWPPQYNNCIGFECGRCLAPAWEVCTNPITNLPSNIPCKARLDLS